MSQASLDEAIALIDAHQEEGVTLLRQIASTGQPDALFVLADLFWSGTMVPQNPAHGRLLFEYAAGLGHTEANLLVTNLLANGIAGKRDWPAAMARLEAEARVIPMRKAAAELVAEMDLDEAGAPRRTWQRRNLSDQPNAGLIDALLARSECEYLIASAQPNFEPSMVYDSSRRLVQDPIRTSDGAAFHWLIEDPAIHAINRRIAHASGTQYEAGEPLQVLRYSPGQQYRPHFDWVNGATNQRILTALIYLNEDYGGGKTAFVRTELAVRGQTGDALIFSNALPKGDGDPLAEHAGLPVTSGTKYLATRWVREQRWTP